MLQMGRKPAAKCLRGALPRLGMADTFMQAMRTGARGSLLAHECGTLGCLLVYSNLWNREALRRTDATTGAARPLPAVGIGLGTHCPVNMCIAACERLGFALYRIAVYPCSLHSIF
jgi:hypothetical protein